MYPFVQDNWDRSLHQVSYNSGLVWTVDDLDTVRLTAGRGVLLPNLLNFGARLAVTPAIGISGSPFLGPTTVNQEKLGWTRTVQPIGAKVRLGIFYEETRDVQDLAGGFSASGGTPYSLPTNIGNSRAKGVEAAIDGTFLGRWRWGLNAQWEEVSDEFGPTAASGIAFVDFEHTTPHFIANAHLGWESFDWETDVYVGHVSRTLGIIPVVQGLLSELTPVPSYVEADARVAYRVTHWVTVAGSGQNLLHESQRQTSGASVERRVLGTVTIEF